VTYNCIDRHLADRANQQPQLSGKAIIHRSKKHISYAQLHKEVCRFANVLKAARRQEGRLRYDLYAE